MFFNGHVTVVANLLDAVDRIGARRAKAADRRVVGVEVVYERRCHDATRDNQDEK